MFSVGDMYQRIKTYKLQFKSPNTKFYFVKVDVQAAFDTIPQAAVVKLMESLPYESIYRIAKHFEIKPGEGYRLNPENLKHCKPIRKWTSLAKSPNDLLTFQENLVKENQGLAKGKKNTVFVETINDVKRGTDELLNLLKDHIKRNLVKIGKKFYRQKEGIPQGSAISSLLCNYFYADLEHKHLSFLNTEGEKGESLLLRLIDDFLLITTNKSHAERFLNIMLQGLPEYGVIVKPSKTLTNFPFFFHSQPLTQISSLAPNENKEKSKGKEKETKFPYCGTLISTSTLGISKDRLPPQKLTQQRNLADSLTASYRFPTTVSTPFKVVSRNMIFI